MKFDSGTHTLGFGSAEEVAAFHEQLSKLLRAVMMSATSHEKEGAAAKELSRVVLQENAAVMRVLNALRGGLERHGS